MLKTNKVIFIDTITREFIKFAKIKGIFPKICYNFMKLSWNGYQLYGEEEIRYFEKRSFYEYARQEGRYYSTLNDNFIKYTYLFSNRWAYGTWHSVDKFENAKELADLFLSHLSDNGYPRYIKIIK
jgi:hypothetical protein